MKIWLLHRGKKIEKKKTAILKNTLNPNFHQNFSFEIPMVKLRDMQFEIAVMDYDLIGRNDTIGKVRVVSIQRVKSSLYLRYTAKAGNNYRVGFIFFSNF